MSGYLTPDEVPTENICRSLFIPDSPEFIAIVTGALQSLTVPENWTKFGALTPEEAAEALYDMLDGFSIEGECETVLYPKTWAIWAEEFIPIGITSFTRTIDAAQRYNYRVTVTTPVDGREWFQYIYLAAGTYVVVFLGRSANASGKLGLYVDDVLSLEGVDFYSASAVSNFEISGTITVTDGWHVLKCKVHGKHASSSGYQINLTKIYFYPFVS